MSHLGNRLIGLVDGELDHDARDKVLAHLAVCEECRAEAEAQRRLKDTLAGLDGPAPSAAFVDRLRALAEPGEPTPPAPPTWPGSTSGGWIAAFHGGSGAGAGEHPRGNGAAGSQSVSRWMPRRAGVAIASVFCLATAAATTAFVVGEPSGETPQVVPPVDRYAVEHAITVPQVPISDPAAGLAVPTGAPHHGP